MTELEKSKCPLCGRNTLIHRKGAFHFEVDDKDIRPYAEHGVDIEDAEWDECTTCKDSLIPHALSKKLDEWQYTREGLLWPEELRGAREKLGFTEEQMAEKLGVTLNQYSHYEKGIWIHKKEVDNKVRSMLERKGG